ncbi:MAG TPA: autotransporter assembly complex family protein [Gammaproteobacteria bacterium]|nr:autotransporter assembly complex family protein [Gammaproteobacteria bacterium]
MIRRDLLLIYCLFGLLILSLGITANAATPSIDVQVKGVSGHLLKNVLAYLSINTYRNSPNLNESLVDRLNARAPQEIKNALQPFGYYQPTIKGNLEATSAGWSVRYIITPGVPVLVRAVDVKINGDGKDHPAFKKYLADLPIKPGQQLNQPAYENLKQHLLDIAARQGYIDAQFTQSVLRVDPPQHWADVILNFETGPRYYFGTVSFVQDFMQQSFLNKYITFKPGDSYDGSKLLNLEYALNDSSYFASVEVQVLRKQATADRRIPIRIVLTPNKRNKYILGIGYGTDTGPRATLGWENRRLNGFGHKFSVLGQYSRILDNTQLSYTVPTPNGPQLVYSLINSRQVFGNGTAFTKALSVNRYTSLNAWSWNQYLQLAHVRSDLVTGTTDSTLLLPGSTFSRSVTDDPIFPSHGYRASLDIRGADQALGSSTSFLQAHLYSKLVFSLGDNTRVLLRGELGVTATRDFNALPLSQRFFAGGDQSVRGFAYDSIGPTDQYGNVIGGKDLMVGSLEVDHMLGRIFGVAAFVDAGNVMNSFNTSLEKGVGVGLRWRTPIGMVRFDIAHPVKRPDLGWYRIHISIGPDL